jgi:hypothetical protein
MVFDEPSGGAVGADPLLPFVLLSFGEVESITAGPPYDERGRVTERQVGLWVPILVRRKTASGTSHEVGFFLPWMWLDNPVSVASGREVYGYPKTWGWATFAGEKHLRGIFDFAGDGAPYDPYRPERTRDSRAFELDSFALREHNPATRLKRGPLLRVLPVGEGEKVEEVGAEAERDFERIRGGMEQVLGGSDGLKQFFLRQFRSPVDGTRASYQDIVRAEAVVAPSPKPRTTWLDRHRIEIEPVASDPLTETLGIKTGPAHLAVEVAFDFDIGPGEILWRSTDNKTTN